MVEYRPSAPCDPRTWRRFFAQLPRHQRRLNRSLGRRRPGRSVLLVRRQGALRRYHPDPTTPIVSYPTAAAAVGAVLLGEQRPRDPRRFTLVKVVGQKPFKILGFIDVERNRFVFEKAHGQ